MLRWANMAVRAIILAIVITVMVTNAPASTGELAIELVALAVSVIVLARWASTPPYHRQHGADRLRPYALATMIVVSGVASALPRGSVFDILALVAALAAGGALTLAAGITALGLGIIATVVTGLLSGAGTGVSVVDPLGLAFLFVLGRNLQTQRAAASQTKLLHAEQARAATLDERARIAREIHDVLAHSLGALSVQIQAARAVLTDRHDQERALEILDNAQKISAEGLTETRRAVHALRGEPAFLPVGLNELAHGHQRRGGAKVTLDVDGPPHDLLADATLALTRIAQEALVNAAKHAPHQPVQMRLTYQNDPKTTRLTIRNPIIRGGQAAAGPEIVTINGGYGLPGMRERLLLLGGTLQAGTDDGEWLVVATVPR